MLDVYKRQIQLYQRAACRTGPVADELSSGLLYNAGARISGETALYADTVNLLSRFIHPAFDSVFHFHLFKREMQQSD